jgi:hypothetical protein
VHGDGLTPAPLVVSGSRVVAVAARYVNEEAGFGPYGLFAHTSTNGGVSFGAGHVVGSVPIFDSVPGPGDTLSGVEENGKPLRFQSVPLDGSSPANPDGTSTVPYAALTTDEFGYNASVGLLDANTPLVVYQRGVGGNDAAFRRYTGSGSVNDAWSWTPRVSIGPLYGPKLAGGRPGCSCSAGTPRPSPAEMSSCVSSTARRSARRSRSGRAAGSGTRTCSRTPPAGCTRSTSAQTPASSRRSRRLRRRRGLAQG